MSEQPTPVAEGNTMSGMHGGALLRQARERAGLHVATLAATLKVPVQRLEALEQGRFDVLPDATFTRALALSVCRVLKIDAAPVLAGLPAGQAPDLGPARDTIGAPMPRESAGTGGGTPSVRERAPWWVALVLVALAGVLWFVLPNADDTPPPVVSGAAVTPPVTDGPATAPASASASAVSPATPLPAASAPGVSTAAGPGDTATAATAATQAAAQTPAPPTAASTPTTAEAQAPSPLPAATAGVLELRIRGGASWIQVTGASGRVWLQRNVQPGETLRFDEDLPLAVTVGRADVTEVVVRGQPFDLAPLARNNVARFEIR